MMTSDKISLSTISVHKY